jgi:hypothetical protein
MTRLLTCILLCIAACEAESDDRGSPPVISDLELAADPLVVGQQADLQCSLRFEDGDGDADRIEVEITTPSGQSMSLATDIAGADGLTTGTATFVLLLVPPEPGEYTVSATVLDVVGSRSNQLEDVLFAE